MIVVSGLTKEYKAGKSRVLALDKVSLTLPNKGMFFLCGKSGSGKSTLLQILGGMLSFDEGEVEAKGIKLKNAKKSQINEYRRDEVAFVFQKVSLLPNLTVEENIGLGGKVKKEEHEKRLKKALSLVGLDEFEQRKCSEISGGEAQRVAIARALYCQKSILLCDEPTGALDKENSKAVFESLKKASESSLVFVVTHDEGAANEYGDYVFKIEKGKILNPKIFDEDTSPVQSKELESPRFSAKEDVHLAWLDLKKSKKSQAFAVISMTLMFSLAVPLLSNVGKDANALAGQAMRASEGYVSYLPPDAALMGSLHMPRYEEDVASFEASYGEANKIYRLPNSYSGSFPEWADFYMNNWQKRTGKVDQAFGYSPFAGYVSVEDCGLTLVGGRAPSEEGECAISLLAARAYSKAGYSYGETEYGPSSSLDIDGFLSAQPLIRPIYGSYELKIVGVYDTRFQYESYSRLDEISGLEKSLLENRLNGDLASGPHAAIFVSSSFLESHKKSLTDVAIPATSEGTTLYEKGKENTYFRRLSKNNGEYVIPFSNDAMGAYLPSQSLKSIYSDSLFSSYEPIDFSPCLSFHAQFSDLSESEEVKKGSYFFADVQKKRENYSLLAAGLYVKEKGLSEVNEAKLIKLADEAYKDGYAIGTNPSLWDFEDGSEETKQKLLSFLVCHISGLDLPGVSVSSGYDYSILGCPSGKEITMSFLERALKDLGSIGKTSSIEGYSQYEEANVSFSLPVAGISFQEETLYVDEKIGQELLRAYGVGASVVGLYQTSKQLKGGENHGNSIIADGLSWSVNSPALSVYAYLGNVAFNLFNVIAGIGTGAFALIFAVALLILTSSIAKRRRIEMGIRRSLGASAPHLFASLSIESLFICFASFLLSLPISIIVSLAFNNWVTGACGIPVFAFALSTSPFLISLSIGILFTLIIQAPTLAKISKTDPVSIMREE